MNGRTLSLICLLWMKTSYSGRCEYTTFNCWKPKKGKEASQMNSKVSIFNS